VAVSGRWSGEDLFSPADRLGRETIRVTFWNLLRCPGILIVDESGAYWRCRAVDAGEENEDELFFSHEY
jgi:hypothetical protein